MLSCSVYLFSTETGIASWYGGKFHGRKTSSGEVYDMYKLTAAHKTLPFGTIVLVTNLENDKTVTVKVNDRGPFVSGRIIDLSKAAASRIDLLKTGTARVKIDIVGTYESASARVHDIQAGSFREEANAGRLKDKLAELGLHCEFEANNAGTTRVIVTDVPHEKLEEVLGKLSDAGIAGPIVRNK